MKCTITFETIPNLQGGSFLLHLAVLVHQLRIEPVALNWAPSKEAANAGSWTLIIRETPRLSEFVSALAESHGVRNVLFEASAAPEPPVATD